MISRLITIAVTYFVIEVCLNTINFIRDSEYYRRFIFRDGYGLELNRRIIKKRAVFFLTALSASYSQPGAS